jgi:chromosome transmission fidelity protein 1
MLCLREDMEARLSKIRAKEKTQRDRYLKGNTNQKKRKTEVVQSSEEEGDEQFVLEDYNSDGERSRLNNGSKAGNLSTTTLELMEKLGMNVGRLKEDDEVAKDEAKVNMLPLTSGASNIDRYSTVLEPTRS